MSCEKVYHANFLAQKVNSTSNLVFVFFGIVVLGVGVGDDVKLRNASKAKKAKASAVFLPSSSSSSSSPSSASSSEKASSSSSSSSSSDLSLNIITSSPLTSYLLALSLTVMGVTSFFWHASMTVYGASLDVSTMYLLLLVLCGNAWARVIVLVLVRTERLGNIRGMFKDGDEHEDDDREDKDRERDKESESESYSCLSKIMPTSPSPPTPPSVRLYAVSKTLSLSVSIVGCAAGAYVFGLNDSGTSLGDLVVVIVLMVVMIGLGLVAVPVVNFCCFDVIERCIARGWRQGQGQGQGQGRGTTRTQRDESSPVASVAVSTSSSSSHLLSPFPSTFRWPLPVISGLLVGLAYGLRQYDEHAYCTVLRSESYFQLHGVWHVLCAAAATTCWAAMRNEEPFYFRECGRGRGGRRGGKETKKQKKGEDEEEGRAMMDEAKDGVLTIGNAL